MPLVFWHWVARNSLEDYMSISVPRIDSAALEAIWLARCTPSKILIFSAFLYYVLVARQPLHPAAISTTSVIWCRTTQANSISAQAAYGCVFPSSNFVRNRSSWAGLLLSFKALPPNTAPWGRLSSHSRFIVTPGPDNALDLRALHIFHYDII